MKDIKNTILQKFREVYGEGEAHAFFAPGRVNLIGEHTDYNGGHVFPCALTIGTYAVARKRNDRKLRFFSMNFEHLGIITSSLDDLKPCREAGWTNYPKGIFWALGQRGYEINEGIDLLLFGNIPNGSGLSSSASVEVVTGYILSELFGLGISNQDLALIGQFSENKFNGVNCGIMDQFAIAMGKKDHAIFLDTADLSYEYAPVQLDGAKIVIACSNKKRGLGDSKYNERREECETALAEIQKEMPIQTLGDLTEEQFEQVKSAIKDDVRRKRAKHAVYENQRTIKAVKALQENNIELFGQLMNASHVSLRDDYEVTGKSQEDVINEILMERRRELWGEGFGITDILRTQKAVERAALSDEMQKTEVDCWQEGGSFEKRNPLGHWFLNFPNGKPFTVNSTYYLYAIPQKEINANPNI